MNIAQLVSYLNEKGIMPYVEAGKLKTRSSQNIVEPEVVDKIRQNKAALIQFLTGDQGATQGGTIPRIANRDQRFPLSFAQQRLWFVDQLTGASAQYNMPKVVRLKGRLNMDLLQQTLNEVVDRHEILRTTYDTLSGESFQIVHPPRPVPLDQVDLSHLAGDERHRVLRQMQKEEANAPFDLKRDLMLRFRFVRLEPENQVLFFTMHHIASDGWSLDLLVDEFQTIYRAFEAGNPSPLDPLPIQYADYAHWQRQHFQSDQLKADLEYWREQLAGIPQVHTLPLDLPRPPVQDFNTKRYVQAFDNEILDGLEQLAGRHGATFFMVYQCAIALFFGRWSHSGDMVIGTPIAGRTGEVEGLIGCFVNNLILRTNLSKDVPFTELLGQVKQTALEAYAHQTLSFDMLVEDLKPVRSLSHSPICQIVLAFQTEGQNSLTVGDLDVARVGNDFQVKDLDIHLAVTHRPGQLAMQWLYSGSLFHLKTIEGMAASFETLLRSILAAPETRIWSLPMLSRMDLDALENRNRRQVDLPASETIPEWFEAQVIKYPEHSALWFEGQSMTYAELNQEANKVAHYLMDQGVKPGDLVGLCLERAMDVLVGILGILKSGAAYLPIDPNYPEERIAHMLEDSGVEIILCQTPVLQTVPILNEKQVVPIEPEMRGLLFASYSAANPAREDTGLRGHHLAYVIYTSGSTGLPKGVAITHRNVVNLGLGQRAFFTDLPADSPWPQEMVRITPESRVVQFVSFSFDAATWDWVMALLNGGCLYIASEETRQYMPAFADYLIEHRITHASLPTALLALMDAERNYALKCLVVSGDKCNERFAKRWSVKFPTYNGYGPTETTVAATLQLVHPDEVVSIGHQMANYEVYVLDKQRARVPLGVIGELYIGGEGVGQGYLNRPGLTAERFIENPFASGPASRLYRTGDLVRYLNDGNLQFMGRADDQVKIRGFRVELGEIEAFLAEAGEVQEVVVIVKGEDSEKKIVAYLGCPESAEDRFQALEVIDRLRAAMKKKLPDYMIPAAFVIMERFPLNPNGKVDKSKLPEPDYSAQLEYVPPETSTEIRLAAIWMKVLKLERVSVQANFFELGGHSLLATQVISEVAEQFQKQLAVKDLFEFATLREFAEHLDQQTEAQLAPVTAGTTGGEVPLSFTQQRLWFLEQLEGTGALYNVPIVLKLQGNLDLHAMQKALDTIVARHHILRTTYMQRNEAGVQILNEATQVQLEQTDFAGFGEDEMADKIHQAIADTAGQPFDLTRDLMFRCRLIRIDPETHIVVFVIHHIAADGWSKNILIQEFSTLYQAYLEGKSDPLPPLAIQFADYARWQRETFQGTFFERELDYWKQQLSGVPEIHSLPLDKPRPIKPDPRAKRHTIAIDAPVLAKLHQLAQSHNASLFMLVQCAYALLIGRWSGENDVVLGTPVAGRTQKELEPLIGFFINSLVLRTDLSGNPTFETLLQQSKAASLEAYAHQHLPFDMLVDHLQPERSMSHAPIFQLSISYHNQAHHTLSLPDLEIDTYKSDVDLVKADMELHVRESENKLYLTWLYAESLFEASTLVRMGESFATLLKGIAEAPATPIHHLPMVSEADRHLIASFDRAQLDVPRNLCAHALFETWAEETPDAVAVMFEGETLTYAALNAEANRVAHYLIEQGTGPDGMVGLCLDRSNEMIIGILGILKAGAGYLPIDPSYPEDRVAFMLEDSGIDLILTQAAAMEALPLLSEKSILPLDRDFRSMVLAGYATTNPDPAALGLTPGHLGYVIYTSGSTGQPKGVLLNHLGMVNLAYNQRTMLAVSPASRALHFYTLTFDGATWEWLLALSSGAALVICPNPIRKSVDELSRLLTRQRITHAAIPPVLLAHLDPGQDYSLECLIVSGEACDETTAWTWAEAYRLVNSYGPSETTVCATMGGIQANEPVTIGTALANVSLEVLSPQRQPVPIGVAGELYVGGVGVARGYLNRPELTQAKFVKSPFHAGDRLYATGDSVCRLPDGRLRFLGRIDEQVKIRGFRIEPTEIEARIHAVPGVTKAAVLVQENEAGRRLVAYAACPEAMAEDGFNEAVFTKSIRQILKAHLPDYMIPAVFVLMEQLPVTPVGKLDKKALPQPQRASDIDFEAPRTEAELALQRIWQDVLKLDRVGIHDNFFEIGGDSILSIQVVTRANQAGVGISTQNLFEAQTIAELASQPESGKAGHLPQEAVQGELKLLPIQHLFLSAEKGQNHYNQSVLLKVPAGFDRQCLRLTAEALYERHDALRLRFPRQEGQWHAVHEPMCEAILDATCVEEALPDDPAARKAFIAERCNHWQASFDLGKAPLFRAVYFYPEHGENEQGRLLLVIHHMVVDGVSWRVILPDIERAFHQYRSDQPVVPLPKTSSLQAWGEALSDYAQSGALKAERSYWLGQYKKQIPPLPLDKDFKGPGLADSSRTVQIDLDETETKALLQQCPRAYRTTINELLLAALYLGMRRWTGERGMRVRLDGHGRENLFPGLDVTQTVGYFTTVYPLTVWVEDGQIESVIKAVKEQYRAIPNKGIGYGVLCHLADDAELKAAEAEHGPEVEFNYLGQFDQVLHSGTAFQAAEEGSGRNVGTNRQRWHQIGLSGKVFDGRLGLLLDYSENQFHTTTMTALAEYINEGLRRIISHCTSPEAGAYTPSDFPLARMDMSQLDHWQARFSHIQRLYPATPMQKGMYYHSLVDPSAYATQTYPVLCGPIDTHHFRRAWDTVANRHDVFRTAFTGEAENLHQLVLPQVEVPWHEEDLRHLPESEQAAAFERYRHQDKLRGFDFEQPPIMRLALFRLGEERYLLLWTIHHLLCDGWCLPLIYREVLTLYRAYLEKKPVQLKKPAVYEDYIAWLLARDQDRAKAYWHGFMGHLQAPAPLGIDRLGDAEGEGYGEKTLLLDEDATARLREFAKSQQTTVNTVVQLAWGYLLHRYSGHDDVVFGTTISGRPGEVTGIEEMMGLFINTIPVYLSFKEPDTVAEALQMAHRNFQRSNEYGYLSLVEIHQQTGIPKNSQLFESLLVFENYPLDRMVTRKDRPEPIQIESIGKNEQSNFKLTLIANLAAKLKLTCSYQREHFSAATIDRLFEHFQTLFEMMPAWVDKPVLDLEPISETEMTRTNPGPPAQAYPRGMRIHQIFEAQAASRPGAVALVFEEKELTYADLNAQANQVARYLAGVGAGPEDPVGLLVERSPEMVIGLLAILKAGAAYVPLDPNVPEDRLQYILEDTGIEVVLTQQHFLQAFGCLSEKTVVPLDPEFLEVMLPGQSAGNLGLDGSSSQMAYLMYTSGSTGAPKGVMVPHLAVVRLVVSQTFMPLNQETVMLQAGSAAFDAATLEFWGPLLNGGRLVLYPGQQLDIPTLNQQLSRHGVNSMWLTAGLFEQWSHQLPESCDLKWLLAGGDVVPPSAVRRVYEAFPAITVINGYGPTENTTFTCCHPIPPGLDPRAAIPIGSPINGSNVMVLRQNGRLAPLGAMGELCAGGDGLARGYANSPRLTASKFRPHPLGHGERLYHTGDMAYWMAGGILGFLGRQDEQVKLRGYRIEPGEIAAVLSSHPDAGEVAIVLKGQGAGKRLVAYVVPPGESEGPPKNAAWQERLGAHCRKHLPEYMVPSAFVALERLPLTPNGKLDKKALPDPDYQAHQPFVAPRTELEMALEPIWKDVLNLEKVSATGNFFEMGGHSLLAAKVVTSVLAELDCVIHIKDIFTYPTITELAAFIEALSDSGGDPQVETKDLETEEMEW